MAGIKKRSKSPFTCVNQKTFIRYGIATFYLIGSYLFYCGVKFILNGPASYFGGSDILENVASSDSSYIEGTSSRDDSGGDVSTKDVTNITGGSDLPEHITSDNGFYNEGASSRSSKPRANYTIDPPTNCTRNQLLKVRSHLDPDPCLDTIKEPYKQKCSITKKTKCPNSGNWIYEYYSDLEKLFFSHEGTSDDEDNVGGGNFEHPFIGIFVGCGNGFGALNTLRMGTFDDSLQSRKWLQKMNVNEQSINSVCKGNFAHLFHVDNNNTSGHIRDGEVHCFEPHFPTFEKFKEISKNLGYDKKGLKVVNGAVSKKKGTALFPNMTHGIDNFGLQSCRKGGWGGGQKKQLCKRVNVLTLDGYVKNYVESSGPIHILQIEATGFDGDVLLGASNGTLTRVEYLEFEYNWIGSWKKQHLYDVVEMLNKQNFNCYWAGFKRLWRITGCWMLYYDVHVWSHIACVNRKRVPKLASIMEEVFLKTLEMDTSPIHQHHHHKILTTNPNYMTKHYLSDA